MKKIYFLALFILLTFTSNAQFGIKGGIVRSTLNSGFDNKVKDGTPLITGRTANSGYTFGVVYDQCLGCDFSLQPELSYTQKGQSYTTSSNQSTKVELAYLDIPLNVKLKFYKPFYVYAGPILSIGLSKTQETKSGSNVFKENLEDGLKSFDWGLNAGIGIQYDRFFIDGRATRGVISQDKGYTSDDITILDYGFRNVTFQLTGGLFF